jgi:hypothetical protein
MKPTGVRAAALAGVVALAAGVAGGLGTGCDTSVDIPTLRPQCTSDAPACILFNLTLTENGQPVDFVEVSDGALASADAGVLSAPGSPPEYTDRPAAMVFTPSAPTQQLTLDWDDPTASRPTHVMTLRPHSTKVQCFAPCCWGCRATHRVFDKLVSGGVTYTVTSTVDPLTTADLDLVIYPVSSTQPGVDPLQVLLALPEGGSQSSLIVGMPTSAQVAVVAPSPTTASSGGSGSGGGGGSCLGSGNCANGYCGACTSTAGCCTGAVCVSTESCLVNSVASGCTCGSYQNVGTAGVCGDFADNGAPQITSCGGAGTPSCNSQTNWCCPGLVGVQNGATCTCMDPGAAGYPCGG